MTNEAKFGTVLKHPLMPFWIMFVRYVFDWAHGDIWAIVLRDVGTNPIPAGRMIRAGPVRDWTIIDE